MKIRNILFAMCLIFLPAISLAADASIMWIDYIQGDVQILNPDMGEDWTTAEINFPISEGDRFWVPADGRIGARIGGGVYLRADKRTAFDIIRFDKNAVQLYLGGGHIYINNRRGGIKAIQIDLLYISVGCYDNSIATIDLDDQGVAEISALKGNVYAETNAGKTRVGAGKTLTIRSGEIAELAPIGPPDEWERWNLSRDRQLETSGESARYLPDELQEYSSDFDVGGSWIYAGDGYV
jgi:hypothetical protein